MKKGYMELTEKIYLDTFEKCPGSVHFSLLCSHRFTNSSQPQKVSKGRMWGIAFDGLSGYLCPLQRESAANFFKK